MRRAATLLELRTNDISNLFAVHGIAPLADLRGVMVRHRGIVPVGTAFVLEAHRTESCGR